MYAIHCIDTGGPAAIIASVENCGQTTITSPAWKCTADKPSDEWTSQNFDDTSWDVAIQGGLNGASPWGVRPGIGMDAHWIWAHNLQGTDEVWCRERVTLQVLCHRLLSRQRSVSDRHCLSDQASLPEIMSMTMECTPMSMATTTVSCILEQTIVQQSTSMAKRSARQL